MTRRRMKRPEEALHRAVAQYLDVALPEWAYWWHTPSGGKRTKAEAGIMKAMGAKAGIPDIFIVYRGVLFGIELKPPKGLVSPAQLACHSALALAGVRVRVCRSLDAVEIALRDWGMTIRASVLASGAVQKEMA